MTGSPTPGPERRPLKPLLDQAPTPEPPEWLDANIRAAAHEAARKAAAARPPTEQAPDAGRRHWRWGPIGAAVAAVVLGVLIVLNLSKRPDDATQLAQAPTPAAVTAPPPATGRSSTGTGVAASRSEAGAIADAPGPQPERESAQSAVAGAPVPVDAHRQKAASPTMAKRERDRPAGADGIDRRALAEAEAPAPMPVQTTREDAVAALPDTAQRCVDSVETMRREKRIDDARRRLQDCRTRYPDFPYPPELLRALPPPAAPPVAPRTP